MEGWKIKAGKYKNNEIDEKEIVHKFYDFRKKTKRTLYKYFFLLALINIIDENKNEIIFDEVMTITIKKYWDSIYMDSIEIIKLSKKRNSKLEQIFIENIDDREALGKELDKCSMSIKENILQEGLKILPKYVIGAIYGDFDKEIYSFDISKRYLEMNPKYVQVILKNKCLLEDIIKKELEFEIDKINEKEEK